MKIKHIRMVFAAAIIVVLAATSAYYLAQRHFNKDKIALQNHISQLEAQVLSLTPKASDTPKPSYFVALAPFGVKFPYDNSSYNLESYPIQDNIYFDLEQSGDYVPLPAQGGTSCNQTSEVSGLLGYLTRSSSQLTTNTPSVVFLTHLGSYYYYYNYPKPCSYTGNGQQVINEVINGLLADLRKLELVN